MPGRRLLPLLGATTAYLAFVAWATLGPAPWRAEGNQAPVGVLFAMLVGARRWLIALGVAALLTCAIEIAQIPISDRISDPRDLLANSAGAVIGLALAGMVWVLRSVWLAGERALQRSV